MGTRACGARLHKSKALIDICNCVEEALTNSLTRRSLNDISGEMQNQLTN
jgi:hypothetical protein